MKRIPDLPGGLKGATRGIHGRRGKWLVNTSGADLVKVTLRSPVSAQMDFRTQMIEGWQEPKGWLAQIILKRVARPRTINIRELTLSLERPDQFVAASMRKL